MKPDARIARMLALWAAAVAVLLLLPMTHAYGSSNGTQADQDDLLNLVSESLDNDLVDPKLAISGQGLSTDL